MKTEVATFAGGCFWGVEAAFREIPGIINVVSGYTGGHTENPTYEEVCTGTTGHAESVEVTYDAQKVSYRTLVEKFFSIIDPTTVNRQGPDIGEQYRSTIFYHSDRERVIAEKVKEELAPRYLPKPIATSIEQAGPFYRAEEYHQHFAEKHPGRVVCHI